MDVAHREDVVALAARQSGNGAAAFSCTSPTKHCTPAIEDSERYHSLICVFLKTEKVNVSMLDKSREKDLAHVWVEVGGSLDDSRVCS